MPASTVDAPVLNIESRNRVVQSGLTLDQHQDLTLTDVGIEQAHILPGTDRISSLCLKELGGRS